jgi:hypothetical protein
MQLTKECMTRLMALKTAGRRDVYQKAMTVLSETALGAEVTQRFRPEPRIPNCLKYDLQALRRNPTEWPSYAAFCKTMNSVLVTAIRCAFSSR